MNVLVHRREIGWRFALAAAIVVGVWLFGVRAASADNGAHVQGASAVTDACAGCHRAHTAPAAYLLKSDQPGLCLACHGAAGAGADTDVEDGRLRTTGGALRGGGFLYARINTADATPGAIGVIPTLTPAPTVSSWHTYDNTTAGTLWGNGAISSTPNAGPSYTLRCGSCHDPHGNGAFRILQKIPSGSGATTPVTVTDEVTKTYTTTNYWDVSTPAPAEISGWCAQCHTRYHGSAGAAKTPTADAIFTYRHPADGVGTNPTYGDIPGCLKCHVAHGTNAATTAGGSSATQPWPGNGSGTTDNNNSRLLRMDNRGVCQKCHNK